MAALIGDVGRAAMLTALLDGRALPAGELVAAAGLLAPAASAHLARLTDGGLLAVERAGRHRYNRLAGPGIALAPAERDAGRAAMHEAWRTPMPSSTGAATEPREIRHFPRRARYADAID